jgi:alkylation response protein AidB-like acyl-CoA dehydrogenase
MDLTLSETQRQMQATIRRFVNAEVIPVANELEHADQYPVEIVNRMAELGLFGILIPEAYGGLGLDSVSYALVVEELSRGWMSLAGVINSHLMLAYMIWKFGTEEQRRRYLPALAQGERRAGLGLTEADAGSDAASMRTTATRDRDDYLLNGAKMFVTNGERGHVFAILAKTNPTAQPQHRGISAFTEAGIAKLFATEMCERVASEGIQIHGGYGYTEDLAVERYFRDSKLRTVGEGTNEIQRLVIARRLLEHYKI